MQSVRVSPDVASQLRDAKEIVYICNDAGVVMGSFIPLGASLDDLEEPYVPLSEEEVQRRIAAGPLLTTDEVLAKLRALE